VLVALLRLAVVVVAEARASGIRLDQGGST
jgi:hypothetical protein